MARLAKIEKILFYIFLFLIPLQLRTVVFWNGNEWNSVFLYLTDILLISVFLLAIFRKGFQFKKQDFLLLLILIVAIVSLFVGSDSSVSIFHFIKLLEFILLYIYVRSNLEILKLKNIFYALIASAAIQSILAIVQFIKQGSLGLKFIEAGIYAPGEPGVATFIMNNGDKVMRAYGGFPHPNILAGFLLLAIFCIYKLLINPNFKFQISNQFQMTKFQNFILPICLFVLIFALFLTFSRGPILVFLMISLVMFLIFIIRRRCGKLSFPQEAKLLTLFIIFIVSCLMSVIILSPYLKARFFTISLQEEAIDLRFFYNKMALQIIKEKPWLGVGIGNFVNYSENYPAYLKAALKMQSISGPSTEGAPESDKEIPQWIFQPVHNIYLLIAAEIGLLGLIIILLFIAQKVIKSIRQIFKAPTKINPLFFLFIAFLIIGLTDHYFWTLQSGGIIFWLAIALVDSC